MQKINRQVFVRAIPSIITNYSKFNHFGPCSSHRIHSSIVFNSNRFEFAYFKNRLKSSQFLITENIKKTKKSQQIERIIQQSGQFMNIIHLTAILDRIEQQNMIGIKEIVQFVINRLKMSKQFFSQISIDKVRTISNIVCYLGNIKNKNMNQIWQKINFGFLLQNGNNIQKTMLITGLIRLQLFNKVFTLKTDNSVKNKVVLQQVIGDELSFTRILSIWFAYIVDITNSNQQINSFFNNLINKKQIIPYQDQKANHIINLKTYAYTTICLAKTFDLTINPLEGKTYEIIKNYIPIVIIDKRRLQSHQFSLLLDSIKTLKLKILKIPTIQYPEMFKTVLVDSYFKICDKSNTTLRNVANCFKSYNECFGAKQAMLQKTMTTVTTILQQQINYMKKPGYKFNYKMDTLSLSSLFWKVNQCYNFRLNMQIKDKNKVIKQYVESVINVLTVAERMKFMDKFSNKELLMIYSGFYILNKQTTFKFQDHFIQITIAQITNQSRKFTIKQITMFYSYFRSLKFISPQFCHFIKTNFQNLQGSFQSNQMRKIKYIKQNQKCTMDLEKQCKGCFLDKFTQSPKQQ